MADDARSPVLALTTVSSPKEAERLARLLVDEHLAACVNIVPGLHSVYRWQGAVEHAAELLLIIKTSSDLVTEVQAALEGHHSYEVPEFLVLTVQTGSPDYLRWLLGNLR